MTRFADLSPMAFPPSWHVGPDDPSDRYDLDREREHDIDPSDRWDLDREFPGRNTDYTASIPAPEGAIIMQAIKPAEQLVLGDRLVVPGTNLSSPIRFIHRDDDTTAVEVETGEVVVLGNGRAVRVVEAVD